MYYLRSRAAADAIKFTVDSKVVEESETVVKDVDVKMAAMVCSIDNKEECMSCGS
jgi:ribonucleoside-diphosphate reductase subunit M1